MAPCLQGQHRPSAPVGVTWRFDAPDSTAMLTPRRSLSSLASLQLKGLYGDFDAALHVEGSALPHSVSTVPRNVCWHHVAAANGIRFTPSAVLTSAFAPLAIPLGPGA